MRCDCRYQLTESLTQIAEKGRGVIFYLQQEGRGLGLSNKIRAYNLQDKGLDTVEANHQLGFKEDERDYEIISEMINFLAIKKVDLMTNNPKKIKELELAGIEIEKINAANNPAVVPAITRTKAKTTIAVREPITNGKSIVK